MTEHCRKT